MKKKRFENSAKDDMITLNGRFMLVISLVEDDKLFLLQLVDRYYLHAIG